MRLKQALTVLTATFVTACERVAGLMTCIISSPLICDGASSLTQPQILFSHSVCLAWLMARAMVRHSVRACSSFTQRFCTYIYTADLPMPAALLDALPPPSSPLTPVPLSAQAVSRVAVIRVSAVFFMVFSC